MDIASGTKGRTLGADDAKVLYTDIEASHHILKNIGDKQVAYFSGAGTSISKVDVTGENFELIHRTMLPGLEGLEKNLTPGIKTLLKKVDAAQAALDEKTILGLTDEAAQVGFTLDNLTNATYKMIDKDGFLYTIMGAERCSSTATTISSSAAATGEEGRPARQPSQRHRQGVSRIIGIGMTWDGHLAIVAPG